MRVSASVLGLLALTAACGQSASTDRIDDEQAASGAAVAEPDNPAPAPEEDASNAIAPPAPIVPPASAPDAAPLPEDDPMADPPGDLADPAPPGARTVSCRVRSGDWVIVDGPCRFVPQGGGSFTLDRGPDEPLGDDILSVTVSVVQPGRAEVRGLTDRGINARWGSAGRWSKDPACWVGSDFEVCAR